MAVQHLHLKSIEFNNINYDDAVEAHLEPQFAWLQAFRDRKEWADDRNLIKALVTQAIRLEQFKLLQQISAEVISIAIAAKNSSDKLLWIHWLILGPNSWTIVYKTTILGHRMLTSELVDTECPQFVHDLCKKS